MSPAEAVLKLADRQCIAQNEMLKSTDTKLSAAQLRLDHLHQKVDHPAVATNATKELLLSPTGGALEERNWVHLNRTGIIFMKRLQNTASCSKSYRPLILKFALFRSKFSLDAEIVETSRFFTWRFR
ncbi:uncharacterized protein J3R85_007830 [Psidium guajava]|nr:uncharacterized protein J3R85_007830 [Psidium guajava]